jgi:hypothetical protein
MNPEKAKILLQQCIEKSRAFSYHNKFSPEWKAWQRETEVAIERIFSADSRNLKDFSDISYSPGVWYSGMPESMSINSYTKGMETARQYLISMIKELDLYGDDAAEAPTDIKSRLRELFRRFHLVGRQLRQRREGRATIEIENEYDVQDILHALLHLYADDIRAEEWTPSYAGGSARMDFLLKKEKIVIEVKKTRKGLQAKEVGDQLIIDTGRYSAHPECRSLFCFVYDPEGRISNPAGLESDLSRKDGTINVEVFVFPKGT